MLIAYDLFFALVFLAVAYKLLPKNEVLSPEQYKRLQMREIAAK